MTKCGIFVALLGGMLGVWIIRYHHDAAAAQRAEVVVTRIFTGPDGQTHAEDTSLTLRPGGAFTEVSDMAKASGVQFRRQEPHYFEDWHTAPRKQYVVTLSGRGEIELTDGKKIPLGPGRILLAEDLTGKGHISRGIGSEERISLVIPVAE
jgi:hypothetical protein